jgi:antitoxin component of MazEF toxin-antitoxin module
MEMRLTDGGDTVEWLAQLRKSGSSTVITVPADLRDSLGLETGDPVRITVDGQTIRVDADPEVDRSSEDS